MSQVYLTQDGDVLDELCWLYYGYTSGAVERVLAANPGLAEHDVILPAGLYITLPTIERVHTQTAAWADPWEMTS